MSWWIDVFGCPLQGERPGGFLLTDRAVELCRFHHQSQLLDVACGGGATVEHLRQCLGCQVFGVDSDPLRQGTLVALGQAQQLPFPDGWADGVFMECSLSQMEQPELVLAQCARVLRPGGKLVVSDLYARALPAPVSPMGRLDTRQELERRLMDQGLEPILFEDHSPLLTQLWAGALMSGKGAGLLSTLNADPGVKAARCGYYLCVAQR